METLEAIQRHEDQEFDALVSSLEEPDLATGSTEVTEYGSDDEDFASICMEVIDAAEAKDLEKSPEDHHVPSDDMDVSVG